MAQGLFLDSASLASTILKNEKSRFESGFKQGLFRSEIASSEAVLYQ